MLKEKYLLLDLGDTLVEIEQSFDSYTLKAIASVLKSKISTTTDEEIKAFFSLRNDIRKEAHQSLKETSIAEYLLKGFSTFLDIQLTNSDLIELEEIYIQSELDITSLFSDTIDFLKYAQENEREIYIVTNNFSPIHVDALLDKFKIRPYVLGYLVSGSFGIRKPHPDFLNRFFNLHQIAPENAVIVGDKYHMDVLAGKACGIKTCLINRKNEPVNMTQGPPDYVYSSLSEIKFA